MRKTNIITLTLVPILSTLMIGGCSSDDEPMDRDVYQTKEECVKDWNEGDLCEKMNDDDDREYHGGVGHGYFWGPTYYRSDRSVVYRGNTLTPTGKSTSLRPFSVTSSSSPASRSSLSSPRTTYGGFGGKTVGGGS